MEYMFCLLSFAVENFKKKTFVVHPFCLPTMVITNDVQNITHVLKTNFDNYPKGPDMKVKFQDVLGDGIFNAE